MSRESDSQGWGVESEDDGVYVLDEETARQMASDDLKLVHKVGDDWYEAELMIPADAVEAALRALIADVDYDLHKQIECDEEDGTDHYPGLAANFIAHMEARRARNARHASKRSRRT